MRGILQFLQQPKITSCHFGQICNTCLQNVKMGSDDQKICPMCIQNGSSSLRRNFLAEKLIDSFSELQFSSARNNQSNNNAVLLVSWMRIIWNPRNQTFCTRSQKCNKNLSELLQHFCDQAVQHRLIQIFLSATSFSIKLNIVENWGEAARGIFERGCHKFRSLKGEKIPTRGH